MKAGPLSKYSFINAKLRARISKIISDDFFRRIGQVSTLDEAFGLLRETCFAELEKTYAETGDLKQVELELLKDEIELYKDIRTYFDSESAELVEVLLSRFEIDNLKNVIRVFFSRKIHQEIDPASAHYILYEPIIHNIPYDLIVNAESFEEIAGLCEATPYRQIISMYSEDVKKTGSLFRMEIAFDHFYYERLISVIKKLTPQDRNLALRLIGVEIDLQNIAWTIRLKKFYGLSEQQIQTAKIPGGLSLNTAAIEDLYRSENVLSALREFVRDQYPGLSTLVASQLSGSTSQLLLIRRILDEIRKHEVKRIMTGYPFTVGIIMAYFILKNEEIKKIRMILNAKYYGQSAEKIESMI